MALNFPNSPSLNDLHEENLTKWRWNGSSWIRVVTTSTAGAQGFQGAAGAQGATAAQGAQGDAGAAGIAAGLEGEATCKLGRRKALTAFRAVFSTREPAFAMA